MDLLLFCWSIGLGKEIFGNGSAAAVRSQKRMLPWACVNCLGVGVGVAPLGLSGHSVSLLFCWCFMFLGDSH